MGVLVDVDGIDEDSFLVEALEDDETLRFLLEFVSLSDVQERFVGTTDISLFSSFTSFLKKFSILYFFKSRGVIKSGELLLTFPTSSETG